MVRERGEKNVSVGSVGTILLYQKRRVALVLNTLEYSTKPYCVNGSGRFLTRKEHYGNKFWLRSMGT